MSLLRLLTAGKCLMGAKEPTTRYQMRTRFLLPKFGSANNPFAAPAAPSVSAAAQPVIPDSPPSSPGMPAAPAANETKETRTLPATAPAAMSSKAVFRRPSRVALALGWLGRWAQKLKPRRMSQIPRQREIKAARARFSRPPVQGELSLDQIRVVRNDLSEADVEIVPARSAAKSNSRPLTPVGAEVELAGSQST